MKNFLLTIAIPTFNRNEALDLTLRELSPQLTSECQLIVLDNHSNDTSKDLLVKFVREYSGPADIKVIRHRGNVGANENILRCIENSDGKFVWLLGDDDTPLPNAVKTVLSGIKKYPNALVFNYYLECPEHEFRDVTSKTYGSVDYLRHTKSMGELVFISNIVLSVRHALLNLNEANLWQSSHVSQLIVTIMILRGGHEGIFSDNVLVTRELRGDKKVSHGSILPIATGIGTIMFPRWTYEEAQELLKLKLWFSVFTVINQLVILASFGKAQKKMAHNYCNNINRTLRLKPFTLINRLLLLSGHFFILFPNFSIKLRDSIYKYKNDNKITLDFNR